MWKSGVLGPRKSSKLSRALALDGFEKGTALAAAGLTSEANRFRDSDLGNFKIATRKIPGSFVEKLSANAHQARHC
jgi:hypothetical protein